MKRLKPRKSLSEQVAEALAKEIGQGSLKLGEMLSETRIAQDLGVSRTPVREAFSHLEFQGLLITKPQSGTFVFDPSQSDISELFDMRSVLELKGYQSSQHASGSEFANALMGCSEQMEAAFNMNDTNAYADLDNKFHESFVKHSGNRLLISLYQPISMKIRALTKNGIVAAATEAAHLEHVSIAKKFSQNQLSEALELARKHLARSEARNIKASI